MNTFSEAVLIFFDLQFSVIVLLNLDRSLYISQQWQFSVLSFLKIVLNQKNQDQKICLKLFLRKEQLI